MPNTSIRVFPKHYGGSDARKREKYRIEYAAAKRIEQYLKDSMATEYANRDYAQFTYWDIADQLLLDEELVRKLLHPAGGGQSGITIVRPKREED